MAKESFQNPGMDPRQITEDGRQGDADIVQMYGGVLGGTTEDHIAVYDATGNVIDSGIDINTLLLLIGLVTRGNTWSIVIQPGYAFVW